MFRRIFYVKVVELYLIVFLFQNNQNCPIKRLIYHKLLSGLIFMLTPDCWIIYIYLRKFVVLFLRSAFNKRKNFKENQ